MKVKISRDNRLGKSAMLTGSWTYFRGLTVIQTLELAEIAELSGREIRIWIDDELPNLPAVEKFRTVGAPDTSVIDISISVEIDLMQYLEYQLKEMGQHDDRDDATMLEGMITDVADSLARHIDYFKYDAPKGVDVAVWVDR